MLWLITAFAAFATLAMLYLAAIDRAAAQRRATVDRVGRAVGVAVSAAAVDSILKETQSDLGNLLSGAAKRYQTLRELELLLYRAGSPMTLVRLLALTAGLGIAGALLGSLAGYGPLPAVLGAGPLLAVKRMKKKRLKTFDEQFPAALGLFSRALRAGHSMTSALQMVGSEMADPVGPEFALVFARDLARPLAGRRDGEPPGAHGRAGPPRLRDGGAGAARGGRQPRRDARQPGRGRAPAPALLRAR